MPQRCSCFRCACQPLFFCLSFSSCSQSHEADTLGVERAGVIAFKPQENFVTLDSGGRSKITWGTKTFPKFRFTGSNRNREDLTLSLFK